MKPTNVSCHMFKSTGTRISVIVSFDVEKELNLPVINAVKDSFEKRGKLCKVYEKDIAEAVAQVELD